MKQEQGFTLAELLVATGLILVITVAVLAMSRPGVLASRLEPASADLSQRARVVVEMLSRDIAQAGAGVDAGPRVGPLGDFIPVVVPRLANEAPGTARADAITLRWVPDSLAQSALAGSVAAGASTIDVLDQPSCPPPAPYCGFGVGARILVFDRTGRFDDAQIAGSTSHGATGSLLLAPPGVSRPFAAGAVVAEATTRSYYFDAAAGQLRAVEGGGDTPFVDLVSHLEFRYLGIVSPPTRPKPALGESNCLYDAAGGMKPAITLGGPADTLVPLPLTMFTDGPWCGDGAAQFDADLLRVRQVQVAVQLQSAAGGPARDVQFAVTPRNLSLER